jgi:hypothetical protein
VPWVSNATELRSPATSADLPRHQSIMPFDWVPSSATNYPATGREGHDSGRDLRGLDSGRSGSNAREAFVKDCRPLGNYHSVYSTRNDLPDLANHDVQSRPQDTIGQVISAPGREFVEISRLLPRLGPPRMPSGDAPSIPPPNTTRSLVPGPLALDIPAQSLGKIGARTSAAGQSCLFEYSDYDRLSRRESTATGMLAAPRATQNWYDKPPGDGDADLNTPSNSLYIGMGPERVITTRAGDRVTEASGWRGAAGNGAISGVEAGDGVEGWRKSRKSVRWGDDVQPDSRAL